MYYPRFLKATKKPPLSPQSSSHEIPSNFQYVTFHSFLDGAIIRYPA